MLNVGVVYHLNNKQYMHNLNVTYSHLPRGPECLMESVIQLGQRQGEQSSFVYEFNRVKLE